MADLAASFREKAPGSAWPWLYLTLAELAAVLDDFFARQETHERSLGSLSERLHHLQRELGDLKAAQGTTATILKSLGGQAVSLSMETGTLVNGQRTISGLSILPGGVVLPPGYLTWVNPGTLRVLSVTPGAGGTGSALVQSSSGSDGSEVQVIVINPVVPPPVPPAPPVPPSVA